MAYFIQKAKLKKGALHREIGLPLGHKIPVAFLNNVSNSKIGSHITFDKRKFRVTKKLKERSVLALTLRRLRRK